MSTLGSYGGRDEPDIPDADAVAHVDDLDHCDDVDVERQRILVERDDQTREWQQALDVAEEDVREGNAIGTWNVQGAPAILFVDGRGHWHGWCSCNLGEGCRHLCALAQLDEINNVTLPVVSVK
jgi:hypothetical protein